MKQYLKWMGGAALVASVIYLAGPAKPAYRTMIKETVEIDTDGGHGSGVIVGPHLILTAKHVIADQDDGKVTIVTPWGAHIEGQVLWTAAAPEDFAMVNVTETLLGPYASISCTKPQVGDKLYAVGNPGDFGTAIVTGIVASQSVKKAIEDPDEKDLLMVEMPMIPGMSGGPVFNANGEVVGLADELFLTLLGGMFPSATGLGAIVPTDVICSSQLPRME